MAVNEMLSVFGRCFLEALLTLPCMHPSNQAEDLDGAQRVKACLWLSTRIQPFMPLQDNTSLTCQTLGLQQHTLVQAKTLLKRGGRPGTR